MPSLDNQDAMARSICMVLAESADNDAGLQLHSLASWSKAIPDQLRFRPSVPSHNRGVGPPATCSSSNNNGDMCFLAWKKAKERKSTFDDSSLVRSSPRWITV
jgi:hypothetical protein